MVVLALAAWANLGFAQDNPSANPGYYIERWGLVDPADHPRIRQVHAIFEGVRAVADVRGKRLPDLIIVKADLNPWALALPDGTIAISRAAIDLCYRDVDQATGDARIAFVLGHELGHLAEDDFWHMETYMALTDTDGPGRLKAILQQHADVPGAAEKTRAARTLEKEIRADESGFVYAAIAGYQIDRLLNKDEPGRYFFALWHQQASHKSSGSDHPTAAERALALQTRLSNLSKKLALFKFGVRLAHFKRYVDSAYFLREFQKVFPSREVFNNLGFCYLQLAVRDMPPERARHFWLPTILDLSSRAEPDRFMLSRGAPDLPDTARRHLETAAYYLDLACRRDPAYVPAYLNLAICYFYMGPEAIYKARAAVEEARTLAPADPIILGMRALIIAREGDPAHTWPEAVKILERLSLGPVGVLPNQYNLAVLLEERGRSARAAAVWQSLAQHLQAVPAPLRGRIVEKSGISPVKLPAARACPEMPWQLPVEVGQDVFDRKSGAAPFSGWPATIEFNWRLPGVTGAIFSLPNRHGALVIDGYIEMAVLTRDDLGSAESLRKRCGEPTSREIVWGAQIWHFAPRWSALIRKGNVIEAWSVHQ